MRRLASQTAAHKLGQILGLLLIPVVVLWSMYFVNAKSEIDELTREISGVQLATHLAQGNSPTPASRALETSLKISEAPQQSNARPLSGVASSKAIYLEKLARASGLDVDGELASNALADVALISLPAFDRLFEQALVQAAAGTNVPQQNAAGLMMVAGEADALVRRIEDRIDQSKLSENADVAAALKHYRSLVNKAGSTVSLLAAPFSTTTDKERSFADFRQLHSLLRQNVAMPLQIKILSVLQGRLLARRAALWRNLLLLTMAGLVSTLAGVGLAVLMMRSTLIQLDEVEKSRRDAHEAKHEADQLNLRFSTINAEISKLNQDLALKVKELRVAQDELVNRGRLDQLGQVTATIAHEIRNPLGAIRTSAFMLQRKTATMGPEVAGQIQRINNGVNRCDTIIAQLLDFSRTKEVHSSPIQLDDWLVRTVREEAKRLPENINIECSLGLDELQVPFDPARMQRAIINLLNNASEALANADGQAMHGSHRHAITVSTMRQDDFAVIRVADNGPGIPPDIISRIREPLFTTKSFGSGLGIPAVEQIAKQHGGHLDIASDAGKGAVFTIHLPVSQKLGAQHAA